MKLKIILSLLLVSIVTLVCYAKSLNSDILDVSFDVAEDATFTVFYILKDAKGRDAKMMIYFENGVYSFYTDKACEKYCFISN